MTTNFATLPSFHGYPKQKFTRINIKSFILANHMIIITYCNKTFASTKDINVAACKILGKQVHVHFQRVPATLWCHWIGSHVTSRVNFNLPRKMSSLSIVPYRYSGGLWELCSVECSVMKLWRSGTHTNLGSGDTTFEPRSSSCICWLKVLCFSSSIQIFGKIIKYNLGYNSSFRILSDASFINNSTFGFVKLRRADIVVKQTIK
jgi:hypothetical protein